MLKRIATVLAGIVMWTGLAALPAFADGGFCKPGGGTQSNCHIMVDGVSIHCISYTEYNGTNCVT